MSTPMLILVVVNSALILAMLLILISVFRLSKRIGRLADGTGDRMRHVKGDKARHPPHDKERKEISGGRKPFS